jgi:hypothetical protein
MLNSQTLEKLSNLGLKKMAQTYREQMQSQELCELSFDDRFGLLVDRQWEDT